MISEKTRLHIERLAKLRRGKKVSPETTEKRRITFLKKEKEKTKTKKYCLNCKKLLKRITYHSGVREGLGVFIKRKYCSLYCARHSKEFRKNLTGNFAEKNTHWRGGRNKRKDGYIEVYSPHHKYKNNNNYVLEHRLVMEKHIGRYLKKKEVVHHIDGNRENNNINNLMVFSNGGFHLNHHLKLKKNAKNFSMRYPLGLETNREK